MNPLTNDLAQAQICEMRRTARRSRRFGVARRTRRERRTAGAAR